MSRSIHLQSEDSTSGERASARRRTALVAMLAAPAALLGACAGNGANEPQIDTQPATLEAAAAQMARVDDAIATHGETPELLRDRTLLDARMDELSGVVDTIEVGPRAAVKFYVLHTGAMALSERRPKDTPSAVDGIQLGDTPISQIYARLAPTRAVPQVLLDAERGLLPRSAPADETPIASTQGGGAAAPAEPAATEARTGDVSVTRSALTEADGPYFRANFCPTWGVFFFCLPDWWNGAFAQASSDHTHVWLAPFSGAGSFTLTGSMNGGAVLQTAAFTGDIVNWWIAGPWHNVPDGSCCFICACATHREAQVENFRWDVGNATNKGFHFGGNFYNNPRAWNGP